MKQKIFRVGVVLLVAGSIVSAWNRLREEAHNRRVAIVVDWAEVRDLAAREAHAPIDVLKMLREQGVTAVVLGGITLQDLWRERRLSPLEEVPGREPFDTSRLSIPNPALASLLYWEFSNRSVSGLERPKNPARAGSSVILQRLHGTFLNLQEIEAGYDVDVLEAARALNMRVIFRVSQDPWMNADVLSTYLRDHPLLPHAQGILFNTDVFLGGSEAAKFWVAWMKDRAAENLLFEFKPPRSQKLMAARLPELTQRAHTIPINELKEMRAPQELARWRRAVSERSCRFLLVHVSPDLSFMDYLAKLSLLRKDLERGHFRMGWPEARYYWHSTPFWYRTLALLLVFGLMAIGPLLALSVGWRRVNSGEWTWLQTFLIVSAISMTTGLVAAALANFPETRLQITPVRGIKLAFLVGWVGSLFILYRPQELGAFLRQNVRRWDLLAGAVVALLLAYALLRSGNAAGGWKSSFEQVLRDGLEWILPARPRFKEFAFGHPLFIMGLYFWSRRKEWLSSWDPRLLVFFGMAGQASMVNTFAHLHSPLELALWRSALGIFFGLLIGVVGSQTILKFRKNVNL